MDRNDILILLRSAKDKERYQDIRDALHQIDEAELFHGLFSLAMKTHPDKNRRPLPIVPAADLLLELNPNCALSCKEAIRAMLPEWQVSLEEVPFYLYKQFGLHSINETIEELRFEPLSASEKEVMYAVRYWARIADEEGIDVLEQRRKECET